jgi:hypothetical protein
MVVWYAGAIRGGSANTMEEENLKSGWRRSGGVIFAPLTRGYLFRASGLSKAR